jgi:hypothetical protein
MVTHMTTKKEQAELKKTFNLFDLNGDGKTRHLTRSKCLRRHQNFLKEPTLIKTEVLIMESGALPLSTDAICSTRLTLKDAFRSSIVIVEAASLLKKLRRFLGVVCRKRKEFGMRSLKKWT